MLKNKNFFWTFFCSVKLTVILLVLIVLFFIIASFIPQQSIIRETAGGLSPLLFFLNPGDMYHSLLFYVLMGLLLVNILVCSFNRFPATLKRFKSEKISEPEGIFQNVPGTQIIITDKERNFAESVIEKTLREQYRRVRKIDAHQGVLFFGERQRFSVFGVYVVHLSIVVMILGSLVGSIFGLEANINIREGDSADIMQIQAGGRTKSLDFAVRCDKFIVELYDNGSPKTYRSDLSFIRNGRVEKQGSVLVNHPLEFGGLRFYQSSYGMTPDVKAVLVYTAANQKNGTLSAKAGDTFPMADGHSRVHVLHVAEDVMKMGPAVKLKITSGQKEVQFWVFRYIDEMAAANPGLLAKVPFFNPGLYRPYVFVLERVEPQYFTGLRIARDPGVPFVAAGATLMVIGLLIIFFFPHQRFWVRMDPIKGKIMIRGASLDNRNRPARENRAIHLLEKIGRKVSR